MSHDDGVPVDLKARIRGSLLAGAVGDALGAPVEFWSLTQIRKRLGRAGITGYIDPQPAVTDDTQMTLFTAEGMIRAALRMSAKGICHPPSVVHHAYLRWLHTQGVPWVEARGPYLFTAPTGWLVGELGLHRRREPGNTCLTALQSGQRGTTTEPINTSKGCGAVMRAAPIGLFVSDPEQAFTLGCDTGALTHGHPSGWLPSGVLAATLAGVCAGGSLATSLDEAYRLLHAQPGHDETAAALEAAISLATRGLPEPEQLETLGAGWVGEEALAIAVCCALAAPDLPSGLLAAVNHSGDSDSTGSICGNLLGAALGEAAIPRSWINALDVADIVGTVADDLWSERTYRWHREDGEIDEAWWARYPGS